MSTLTGDAEKIFESACLASGAQNSPCDLAIIIGQAGAIQIVEAAGWRLDSLESDYGARRVYRITRSSGHVRVEGRAGPQTCLIESTRPSWAIGKWSRPGPPGPVKARQSPGQILAQVGAG